MVFVLIETARQYISVGIDYAAAPEAIAMVSALLAQDIMPIFIFLIARIAQVGGHERMSVCIIIQLGSFEGQPVCAHALVALLECIPFRFVAP